MTETEIDPGYSLEGPMLKLKLQYYDHLIRRAANSLEKTLMLGKIEGRRRRGWQRMSWLDGITDSVDMNFSKLWETVKDREAWHATVQLSNWTTTKIVILVEVVNTLRISICQSSLLNPGCTFTHEENFETLKVLEPHPWRCWWNWPEVEPRHWYLF